MFTADVLLNTPGIVGSADNDINSVRNLQEYSQVVILLIEDLLTLMLSLLKLMFLMVQRCSIETPLQTKMEPDFDTGNLRFKARERYSFGVSDWRG